MWYYVVPLLFCLHSSPYYPFRSFLVTAEQRRATSLLPSIASRVQKMSFLTQDLPEDPTDEAAAQDPTEEAAAEARVRP